MRDGFLLAGSRWQRLRGGQLAGVKFRCQYPFSSYALDFVSLEKSLMAASIWTARRIASGIVNCVQQAPCVKESTVERNSALE